MRYGGNTPAVQVRGEWRCSGLRRREWYPPARRSTLSNDYSGRHPSDPPSYGSYSRGWAFSHHFTTRRSRFTSGDLPAAHSRWKPAYRAISPRLCFQYTFAICTSVSCHRVPRPQLRYWPISYTDRARLSHPGPTVGYRIEADGEVISYLSDHEPATLPSQRPVARTRVGLWLRSSRRNRFTYSYTTLNIRMRSTTAMWDGGIAPTDMRSNSHLMSARGSLLRFITTQTTTTRCWTVCRKIWFGA